MNAYDKITTPLCRRITVLQPRLHDVWTLWLLRGPFPGRLRPNVPGVGHRAVRIVVAAWGPASECIISIIYDK